MLICLLGFEAANSVKNNSNIAVFNHSQVLTCNKQVASRKTQWCGKKFRETHNKHMFFLGKGKNIANIIKYVSILGATFY